MCRMIIFQGLIAMSFLALIKAELKVTQVQVLFRHGERTPRLEEEYPNDIHNVSEYEPPGFAQLTKKGMMREYRIGQVLRNRYHELLGPRYIPEAVHAVSSDTDRAKMSLQLTLAGLFPPSEAEKWHPELLWMPIPTHYVPGPLDIVLRPILCPEYKNAVAEVFQRPEVRAKIASYEDLFKFLTIKTGMNVTEVKRVYNLYFILESQHAMNLKLPEWCTDEVIRQMAELTVLWYEISSYTRDIKRINGGHLVRTFIENMHPHRAKESRRKIHLYSAHEDNIEAFLRAQEITQLKIPSYGSTVIVEKLRDTDGNLFVRLVLWTGVTEELITLRLPGCEEICPIEKYLQLTRDVIPSDEEADCHWRRLSLDEIRDAFKDTINYN